MKDRDIVCLHTVTAGISECSELFAVAGGCGKVLLHLRACLHLTTILYREVKRAVFAGGLFF